jgi:hypothetical protein
MLFDHLHEGIELFLAAQFHQAVHGPGIQDRNAHLNGSKVENRGDYNKIPLD